MGLFDTFQGNAGGLGLGFGGGGGGGGNFGALGKKQLNFNSLYPTLLQFYAAQSALGQDPTEALQQYKVTGKAKKGPGILHIGNAFYDIGAVAGSMPQLLQQQQQAQSQQFQTSYDTLSKVPALAGVFNEANGNFGSQFTSDINKAYESLGSSLLGQGAQSGFLADPNKQASLLGPLALDKEMFLKNLQKASEQQAFGLAGGGGLAGAGPVGNLGAGPAGSYLGGIFNTAGMNQQANQFQQQLGFQQWATKLGLGADVAGGVLGGFAGFGGF